MFLHIGDAQIVFFNELIGIFHFELLESEENRDLFQKNNFIALNGNNPDPPDYKKDKKSFIVTDRNYYLSPVSPRALHRRRKSSSL